MVVFATFSHCDLTFFMLWRQKWSCDVKCHYLTWVSHMGISHRIYLSQSCEKKLYQDSGNKILIWCGIQAENLLLPPLIQVTCVVWWRYKCTTLFTYNVHAHSISCEKSQIEWFLNLNFSSFTSSMCEVYNFCCVMARDTHDKYRFRL